MPGHVVDLQVTVVTMIRKRSRASRSSPRRERRAFFSAIKSRESEHMSSSASTQQEGHDRSQVPSSQRARIVCFPATLFCRSRDFVKSSAERAHRWTRDAHRARGIAWTLFMRRERGPRLDMELVDGSGKGVARGKEWDEDAGVSHFIHGGCLKLGSQCSVRCFANQVMYARFKK